MQASKRAGFCSRLIALLCLGTFSSGAIALDAGDFADLVGFTVVASSRLKGDYYGAAPGNPIVLENGMRFSFSVPFSTYSYRPAAVVFARLDAARAGEAPSPGAYKVLVQDKFYSARRIE